MARRLIDKLTYANVVATLALFVAIGGSSYAALSVGSKEIANGGVRSVDIRNNDVRSKDLRNRSVRKKDIARNSLDGAVIRESRLGAVPKALNADRLNGVTVLDLKVRCPPGTVAKSGACMEIASRAATPFSSAIAGCANAGRRLPSFAELKDMAETSGPISPQPEWTASVYETGGELRVLRVTSIGDVEFGPALTSEQRPFRCLAQPSN